MKARTLPQSKYYNKLTLQDVKLCSLCRALNHKSNGECWTCRWHGAFVQDPDLLALAWQRLEHQFEEVRLEHVTLHRLPMLDEFGAPRPVLGWQKVKEQCCTVWANFQIARDLRMAQRDARLRYEPTRRSQS